VSTSVASPTAQSEIVPTFPAAAAAVAPAVRLREKKPRRDGFREQFLKKVKGASKDRDMCLSQPNSSNLFFASKLHPTQKQLREMLDRESQNDK